MIQLNSKNTLLFLSYAFILLITIAFFKHWPAWCGYLLCFGVIFWGYCLYNKDKLYFCGFTALTSLLGPVYKVTIPSLGWFNIGDFFLLLMAFSCINIMLKKHVKSNKYRNLFRVMLMFVIINLLLSGNIILSMTGLLNMIQIAIVYIFTFNIIKTQEQARTCINFFIFAVLICSIVQLYAYSHGIDLNISESAQLIDSRDAILGSIDSYFVKAGFFYRNFYLLCAIIPIICLRYIILGHISKIRIFLTAILTVAVVMIAGSITSRTPVYTVLCLVPLLFYVQLRRKTSFSKLFSRGIVLTIFILTLLGVFLVTVNEVISQNQRDAYSRMFFGDASESMNERYYIWHGALEKPFSNPKEFIFGVGPNVNLKLTEHPDYTGYTAFQLDEALVCSFHNFFIDVFFQLGLGFGLIIVILFVSTLKYLFDILKKSSFQDNLALDCILCILAFILTGMTLGCTWSKVYFITAQFFAFSHLLIGGHFSNPFADKEKSSTPPQLPDRFVGSK